jgi:dienelactone hydrolase
LKVDSMLKKLYFENEGQQIEGFLHLPDNTTQSLVILVHGFTGSRDGPDGIFIKLAEDLVSKSFAVLRFNFRFTTENWSEFHNMTISGEVSDLKLIINEMSKEYGKIGLVGESMGGTISVLSYDEKVKCLVLWYPGIFLNETELKSRTETREAKDELEKTGFVTLEKESTGEKFRIGKKFIEEREQTDIVPYAKRISCPILLIHGDSDTTVPFDQSERLLKILKGSKKLEKIIDANHAWWNKDDTAINPKAQEQSVGLTVEWIDKWLK